jgi:hypothetical protein
MSNCKDCRYWRQGWTYYTPELKTAQTDEKGVCQRISYGGTVNEVLDEVACIYFGIGDDIQFVTDAQFGCALFEAKE